MCVGFEVKGLNFFSKFSNFSRFFWHEKFSVRHFWLFHRLVTFVPILILQSVVWAFFLLLSSFIVIDLVVTQVMRSSASPLCPYHISRVGFNIVSSIQQRSIKIGSKWEINIHFFVPTIENEKEFCHRL